MSALSLVHLAQGIRRLTRGLAHCLIGLDARNPLLWLIILLSLSSVFNLYRNNHGKLTATPCSSHQHTESKGSIAHTVADTNVQIPLSNTSLPSFSFAACCGIGHRLSFIISAAVYAISNSYCLAFPHHQQVAPLGAVFGAGTTLGAGCWLP
jgi:hypothetical protein